MQHAPLQFAGLFLSYFLKIAAAYLLCFGLARLLDNPRNRFRVWMAFLVGSGVYWAILVSSSLPGFSSLAPTVMVTGAAKSPSAPHFFIPLAWYGAVSWTGKLLFWIYFSSFAFLLCRAIWKHWRLRSVLRFGTEPSPELARLFDLLARDCGVRGCRLIILPALSSPAGSIGCIPAFSFPRAARRLTIFPSWPTFCITSWSILRAAIISGPA
jgi:hypothetical protein